MYDTIALVQREGVVLSPATQRLAELAERMLLESVSEHGGRTPLV